MSNRQSPTNGHRHSPSKGLGHVVALVDTAFTATYARRSHGEGIYADELGERSFGQEHRTCRSCE